MGAARWVCLRCLSNYQPVVTADGQDNIVQCGEFTLQHSLHRHCLFARLTVCSQGRCHESREQQ